MPGTLPPPEIILDLLPDAACVVDTQGVILFVNASFQRILGHGPADVLGRKVFDFLHPDDLATTLRQVDLIMEGHTQRHFHNRYLHKDGHAVDMQWSARWHPDLGVRIAVGREITQLRHAEAELERQARLDPLTGLANRRHFHRQLDDEVRLAAESGQGLAVLYIDLDGFKAVNDRHGHGVGDALLAQVAARINQSTRSMDTPSRVGGDEFAVLMPGCQTIEAARQVAQSLRSLLGQPYPMPFGEVDLDASVGVAVYPVDGDSPASLVAHADQDMYAIKRSRREGGA